MSDNAIQTTHALDFMVTPWPLGSVVRDMIPNDESDEYPEIDWLLFQIGTCEGQWRCTPVAYEILSIVNEKPGNGHLADVLEWFEMSAKRDKRDLKIMEFTNEKFKQHLIAKRGFLPHKKNDVIKKFIHD